VAHAPFKVEVLTPEGLVFDEEVKQVSTRTETGSLGILARHQPLLGLLAPTELRLYRSESDVVRFAQGEGYVQVASDGSVLLLVEEAVAPEELDSADLQEKARRAADSARDAEEGSEEQRRCLRDQRRYEAFAAIAGGGA
jgi:F-type H+-transporting ATPase subunit epsilon